MKLIAVSVVRILLDNHCIIKHLLKNPREKQLLFSLLALAANVKLESQNWGPP